MPQRKVPARVSHMGLVTVTTQKVMLALWVLATMNQIATTAMTMPPIMRERWALSAAVRGAGGGFGSSLVMHGLLPPVDPGNRALPRTGEEAGQWPLRDQWPLREKTTEPKETSSPGWTAVGAVMRQPLTRVPFVDPRSTRNQPVWARRNSAW
jgi:hypothetical protein